MNKKIFYLLLLTSTLILGGCFPQKTTSPSPEPEVIPSSPSQQAISPSPQVPLPTGEDIIRAFFNLINEKRTPEAIKMMHPLMVPNQTTQKAWEDNFNSLEAVSVKEIKPHLQNSWTDNQQSYQVSLTIQVSDSAANAPIPFYGWNNGTNIRWLTLQKDASNLWKIAEIATGP
jgi:hypothetical protein